MTLDWLHEVKFVGGPMDGKSTTKAEKIDGTMWFPDKLQVPFMTDEQYINQYGEVRRLFKYVLYELVVVADDCNNEMATYNVVEDDSHSQWQKFNNNPELIGAKWWG